MLSLFLTKEVFNHKILIVYIVDILSNNLIFILLTQCKYFTLLTQCKYFTSLTQCKYFTL